MVDVHPLPDISESAGCGPGRPSGSALDDFIEGTGVDLDGVL